MIFDPKTHLTIIRSIYETEFTQGAFYFTGRRICYSLEDRVRPPGVKIYGQTAIPAGIYDLRVTHSARFDRPMPMIYDVPNFKGIRIHGGNKAENTLGCPLAAYEQIKEGHIYKTAEKEVTQLCIDHSIMRIAIIDTQEPLP